MTTYRPFNNYESVELIEKTEVVPCFYIDKNTTGLIIDRTVPDYYLVQFKNYGAYWIEGSKLKKYN